MGLADCYHTLEDPEDFVLHGGKLIDFSDRAWPDVLCVLRELSVGRSCEVTNCNTRAGTASGVIEVCDKWVYGEMRWYMRDPILHKYTLRYEVGVNPLLRTSHFELTEKVLLPIDMSYIPSFVDHVLRMFPGSSIMTKRICDYERYDYAI